MSSSSLSGDSANSFPNGPIRVHESRPGHSQQPHGIRQEFGFKRTTCSCRKCSLWCEYVPGALVPTDLDRLIPTGDDPFQWAEQHLLASPGFRAVSAHFTLSIPSLVPKRQENGHCHWLQDGRCEVHEVSPYGCAFLSQCSQSAAQAAKVRNAGLEARAKAFEESGLYARIWHHLWNRGFRELTTQQNNRRAAEALRRLIETEERANRSEARRKRRKQKKERRRRKK